MADAAVCGGKTKKTDFSAYRIKGATEVKKGAKWTQK